MQESAKYLIHANITANGVVERSDVVGAIFGQTEGLLGDGLDLRNLQKSSKVGRIDVQIRSENGQSFGRITIASGLDKVETAILAAALETIERVGPCRARVEVDEMEDIRAAKRREVVERATDLLSEFETEVMSSQDLVEEVRQSIRVEDITEYEGLPAGPRVADSDAIIVVEGRADVLQLLQYGIKNAIAVEGTDVPEAVAHLTQERTTTAFLDGDRGGDLILKELEQVGSVDYVAFAPAGEAVEDLARDQVMSVLRDKVPIDVITGEDSPHELVAGEGESERAAPPEATDTADPAPSREDGPSDGEQSGTGTTAGADSSGAGSDATTAGETGPAGSGAELASADATGTTAPNGATADGTASDAAAVDSEATDEQPRDGSGDAETTTDSGEFGAAGTADGHDPETLAGHVDVVIGDHAGTVRLLDGSFGILDEREAGAAFDAIEAAEPPPTTVVLDDRLTQRVLDVAAQRGVEQIVAHSEGEFVKQPTSVRVRTADQFETVEADA
jgi:hypothetical protein